MLLPWLWAGFQSLPHCPQANWALLVLNPGSVACVHSRTLWTLPTDCPVRLTVSPATASPTQVFTTRGFEALFPCAGTLGCTVCLTPQLFLPVYPHANVGPVGLPGLLATALPAQYASRRLAMHPVCASCPSLPLLQVWMNVSSLAPWWLDFHTV